MKTVRKGGKVQLISGTWELGGAGLSGCLAAAAAPGPPHKAPTQRGMRARLCSQQTDISLQAKPRPSQLNPAQPIPHHTHQRPPHKLVVDCVLDDKPLSPRTILATALKRAPQRRGQHLRREGRQGRWKAAAKWQSVAGGLEAYAHTPGSRPPGCALRLQPQTHQPTQFHHPTTAASLEARRCHNPLPPGPQPCPLVPTPYCSPAHPPDLPWINSSPAPRRSPCLS